MNTEQALTQLIADLIARAILPNDYLLYIQKEYGYTSSEEKEES